jgi:hypothetical protein
MIKNKKIHKIISSIIMVSMLMPTIFFAPKPQKAEAFLGFGDIVIDPAHIAVTTKLVVQEILRQFIMTVTRKLLDRVTQSTINWINTGNFGNPFYVENSDNFFKDIAKSQVKQFVDLIGYDNLRLPFGKAAALNAINSYKRQFIENASYTLSESLKDPVLLKSYRDNFYTGGWNGFLINTQYPQNNYVGFQMLATEELARRVAGTSQTATEKVKDTLQQGMGFLSPKTCPSNPNYNNLKNEFQQPTWTESKEYQELMKRQPAAGKLNASSFSAVSGSKSTGGITFNQPGSTGAGTSNPFAPTSQQSAWQQEFDKAKALWEKNNTCQGGLVATTPGSVVAHSILDTMSSKLRQTELGAALGNSLSAVFDALINKFMQKGLNALTNTINPKADNSSLDDFTYAGDSVVTAYNGTTGGWQGQAGDLGPGTVDPADEPASIQGDVAAARAKFGATVTKAEIAQIIVEAATKNTAAGWGLLSKPSGDNCSTSMGPVSCDILYHKPSCLIYDVLGSADDNGPATPQWGFAGSISDTSRFVDIGGGGGGPESACVQVTPPTGSPNGGIPVIDLGDQEASNLLEDLKAVRAKYPATVSSAQEAQILNEVAWKNKAAGWGLLSKPSGHNCPFTSGPISCDILFHKPTEAIYDALGAADEGGPATPQWGDPEEMDVSRWRAPVAP